MSHPQVTRLVPQGVLNDASTDVYAFGPVCVDVARHSVTRDGHPIALAPKAFELLLIMPVLEEVVALQATQSGTRR
jgi:DNA-binding response OmpR family regulator